MSKIAQAVIIRKHRYNIIRKNSKTAIFLLRSVMDYYISSPSRGTTVNIYFLGLSKAFYKVNHNLIFQKLMQCSVPRVLIKDSHSWYSCYSVVVRWGLNLSQAFELQYEVRQSRVLSPTLSAVHIYGIVDKLEGCGLGCWFASVSFGYMLYADDTVIVSPTKHFHCRECCMCAS